MDAPGSEEEGGKQDLEGGEGRVCCDEEGGCRAGREDGGPEVGEEVCHAGSAFAERFAGGVGDAYWSLIFGPSR